jgi:hypothetical protein
METHEQFAGEPFRVTFPGPFTHHKVVVDGWEVPLVEAQLQGEDRIALVLDRRFAVDLSVAEAERVVPFVAHAIAVALGFSAHPRPGTEPPVDQLPNPRPRRVWDIASVGAERDDD